MNYSSPFNKDWKPSKKEKEDNGLLEKFKAVKPKISTKVGRELSEQDCSEAELFWIERWLDNAVRSRSLPPQCAGKDAFNAITLFLTPMDALDLLGQLRKDFLSAHPSRLEPVMEDFSFLLAEMGAYPEQQSPTPPDDHSNLIRHDARSKP
jgi:hypothetical protein